MDALIGSVPVFCGLIRCAKGCKDNVLATGPQLDNWGPLPCACDGLGADVCDACRRWLKTKPGRQSSKPANDCEQPNGMQDTPRLTTMPIKPKQPGLVTRAHSPHFHRVHKTKATPVTAGGFLPILGTSPFCQQAGGIKLQPKNSHAFQHESQWLMAIFASYFERGFLSHRKSLPQHATAIWVDHDYIVTVHRPKIGIPRKDTFTIITGVANQHPW